MSTLYVDERWLVDEFQYMEIIKPVKPRDPISYADPITIAKCRINHKTIFTQDAKEAKVQAEGKIFCYASATTPFLEFKKNSKLIIDGEEYILTKAKKLKEPMADKIFSYELEFL